MRALVTGGAGFIGSNLVDALIATGDDVVVFDDLSSGRKENLAQALERGATLEVGDVADAESIDALFERHRPQRVFHLAAQIDVRRSVADPHFDMLLNVGGTVNLLSACTRFGVERFVLASTGGAIYGEGADRDLPLTEDAERRPDAPYGQSKLAAEGYVDLFARLHGLSTASLRLGNVYGPRQDPHGEAGVVAIFCRALLQGSTAKVFGDGRQTRDYVYVGDVVQAFIAAGASSADGAFNIGTGRETTVIELGEAIASACEVTFDPQIAEKRPGEVQRIAVDSSRAGSEFGWSATLPLEEGIGRTADWARQNA